jgi:hypothetical protein
MKIYRQINNTNKEINNKGIQGADKSLARPGRKQATATENTDVHIFYV